MPPSQEEQLQIAQILAQQQLAQVEQAQALAAQQAGGDDQQGPGGRGSAQAKPKPPRPDKIETCPRCGSQDTKFCYYNNYNVKQPRYFCKACQRYWTAGGTLRNVPPGSGRRKSKSAAAKEHQNAANLAEHLAKQSVASAMLANPATLAAAVPFLNPMLAAESTMLAYNAAAAQQQLLGSAALSALTKMPAGMTAQWPTGLPGTSNTSLSVPNGSGTVAGDGAGASTGGTASPTAGGGQEGGADDVSQQDGNPTKRQRTEGSGKLEQDAISNLGGVLGQQQSVLGAADDNANAGAGVTAGLGVVSSGANPLSTTSAGNALGGSSSQMHNSLAGSWHNLGGTVDMLGMSAPAGAVTSGMDQSSMLNGGVKSPVQAAAAAAVTHNVAAAAALQQQQVLQYQQMMQAQLLQQQLAAHAHVAAAGLPTNPYLPLYPYNFAANLTTFNPAGSAGLQQWSALAAAQPFSPSTASWPSGAGQTDLSTLGGGIGADAANQENRTQS